MAAVDIHIGAWMKQDWTILCALILLKYPTEPSKVPFPD